MNKNKSRKIKSKTRKLNIDNIIKVYSKLSSKEKKYCRCLVKVKSNKIKNPYGICTSSIYNKQNKKRKKRINCSKNYNFKNFNKTQLKYYKK